mmetsp:Transcript_9526/g.23201  ORF Transcript_9526/g.23201 Transcript_9526/m.23201 type:complete len:1246 (-) Transcript_9526:140-3877(-)|eukprot:CAMPEP_0168853492 /NCGR_PEP_ID=MMETSP0727-20121128/13554_1 /TAXON_ID=265536 /ORGANISM="Amphiprora sp., Strain CCMP467" /LENGTH=1245 /DNA_ID=CAMNT_0008907715 /DNA_START=99 /DNA_END=3836 /DNA_ORIENTATION=-
MQPETNNDRNHTTTPDSLSPTSPREHVLLPNDEHPHKHNDEDEDEEQLSKNSPESIATAPAHNRSSSNCRRSKRDDFAVVVNMNQVQRINSRGTVRGGSAWNNSRNQKGSSLARSNSFRSYESKGESVSSSHHDTDNTNHQYHHHHPQQHQQYRGKSSSRIHKTRRWIRRTLRRTKAWLRAPQNRTLILRLCFVVSLLIAAALLGYLAHRILSRQEEKTATLTYESIAASALEQAQAIVHRKFQGAQSLATTWSYAFPQASQWPFVGTRAYTELAGQIATMSASAGHGFMALVTPEQVPQFEAHARALYQEYGYPPTAGWSDFGFGIYGVDPSQGYDDGRFHDASGNTTWNSKYKVMAPFLQHKNTFSNPDLLLRNLYQFPLRGKLMESIIDCGVEAGERAAQQQQQDNNSNNNNNTIAPNLYLNTTVPHPQCGGVTGFTEIFVRPGPSAVFFNAIFPLEDPYTVVGFIGTSINFRETLTNVVPDYVQGLHCVITSNKNDGEAYTYSIDKGEPILLGKGDFHDSRYDKHSHRIVLNDFDTGAQASVTYYLTVYPTDSMYEEFQTHLPLWASIGFVAVIVVCTGIFFVYDSFMKYESHQQQKILQVKRRFVRYISHEIRTPLNVVSMGLSLLQTELKENLEHEEDLLLQEQKKEEERQEQEENGSVHIVNLHGAASAPQETTAKDLEEQDETAALMSPPPSSEPAAGLRPSRSDPSLNKKKEYVRTYSGNCLPSSRSRKRVLAHQTTTSQENAESRVAENVQNNKYWLQLAEEILENSQNAVSVLNDLLTYDKVESKSLTLDLGRVNIFSSIKKTVKEFSLQARNRSVELKLLYVPDGEQRDEMNLEPANDNFCIDVDDGDLEAPPVATVTRLHSADMLAESYQEEDFIENPESLFVIGDERRLFQVIRNLLSNALKFTPEHKSVTISVTYALNGLEHSDPPKQIQDEMDQDHAPTEGQHQQNDDKKNEGEARSDPIGESHSSDVARLLASSDRDGSIRITVTDDGVGMSPDQLKILFNEGVQFNPNVLQHGGGSGLGLAITKEFVELHGGTIIATSQGLGHGSEFFVELPLYRELPRSYPEDVPTTVHGSTASLPSQSEEEDEEDATRHVLVVDDVMTNKKMLVRLLERAGHQCAVAENGKEAIDVYMANEKAIKNDTGESEGPRARPFDTILMDFEMPVMNGPDATKRLRGLGCKADIFGVTGNVLTEDVMTFKANGADMVLYKPINLQTIEAAWENMERLRKM